MPTRNVVITDHQAKLIDRLVKEGRYQNGSEVLRDALRLIETREADEKAKLEALRAAIQVGVDDIEAGRFYTFETREALRRGLREWTDEALNRSRSKSAAE